MDNILDQTILNIPHQNGVYNFTWRNAFSGTFGLGASGAGKTSGSGQTYAKAFLLAEAGGIVFTSKRDERDLWIEWCKATGRSKDLIIIGPNSPYHFNFIDYEAKQNPDASTDNVVQVLRTIIQGQRTLTSHGSNDSFFQDALDMLLFNVIDLCKLAYDKVSVELIYDIVQSIPKMGADETISDENNQTNAYYKAIAAARRNVTEEMRPWVVGLEQQTYDDLIASNRYDKEIEDKFPKSRLFAKVESFFKDNYNILSPKTRSIVDFSFTSFMLRLLREPLYSTFCRYESNVTPEDTYEGKIILIDFPLKVYNEAGRSAQLLWKYAFQRAVERRDISKNGRPVFLYADEAHMFLLEHDPFFQATARSSRVATFYLTQNLSSCYDALGGTDKSKHKITSLLGNMSNKIFHLNGDTDTNNYGSTLIGEALFEKVTRGKSMSDNGFSNSSSTADQFEKIIRPEDFTTLASGGPRNKYRVDAIMHIQDGGGDRFLEVSFNQKQ